MKYLLISFSVLLFFFACKSTKETVEEQKIKEEDRVFLSLKKGPCFGKCPVFTISIYKSGLAEFHGKAHTGNLGKFKKNISLAQLDDLMLSCEDADILSMLDMYPSQIADLPLITIKYMTDDSTKVVKGKEDRPAKLIAVERKLVDIVNSDGWELVEAANLDAGISPPEDQREELVKTEIIIQPADGIKLPIWIQKNKKRYGIRLLDRISADKNYWLITWDQAKGDPDEFMDKLQRDPDIKMAQFNLKVEGRSK